MFYMDREVMSEFENLFFERLSNDEVLDKLVCEKNVDLEKVLFTYVDDFWGHSSITITSDLMKNIFDNGVVKINSLHLSLRNDSDGIVSVSCDITFSYKMNFPETIAIGDDIKFDYVNRFGLTCDNAIVADITNSQIMASSFEVHSLDKLLDVTFEIMHNLLKKENN